MPPFGPLPRVWYVVGALAACILVTNGVLAWRQQHASERVRVLTDTIRVESVVYTRDTVVRRVTLTKWSEKRDTLLKHDTTTLVREAVAACDSALAADSVVIRTGERRDSLHRQLEGAIAHASAPKPLTLYGEALAGYQWQAPELRAGATMRLTKRWQVVGEVAHRLDDGTTFGRVGVRLTY